MSKQHGGMAIVVAVNEAAWSVDTSDGRKDVPFSKRHTGQAWPAYVALFKANHTYVDLMTTCGFHHRSQLHSMIGEMKKRLAALRVFDQMCIECRRGLYRLRDRSGYLINPQMAAFAERDQKVRDLIRKARSRIAAASRAGLLALGRNDDIDALDKAISDTIDAHVAAHSVSPEQLIAEALSMPDVLA